MTADRPLPGLPSTREFQMTKFMASLLASVVLAGAAVPSFAATPAPVRVGKLADGSGVMIVRTAGGGYGVEVAGTGMSRIAREKPVRIEVFHNEQDIRTTDVSYSAVTRAGADTVASVDVTEGKAVLHIEDRYRLAGAVVTIDRTIRIEGSAPGLGFTSGLILTAPNARFTDTSFFSPGALYGGPGQNNEGGSAGSDAFAVKNFQLREDALPAPMIGMTFPDQSSIALLHTSPIGDTTEEDTRTRVATVLIDKRFSFGAFGGREDPAGGVEFGFWFPGTIMQTAAKGSRERRRYHPIEAGIVHDYHLALRLGKKEDLPRFERDAWRWAYGVMKPKTTALDLDVTRRVLFDHMADQVKTIDGRTGIPWIHQITTGDTWHRPDDMRASIGFVGKNIEVANLFLIEADRDPSPRGQRLRQLALQIIQTFTTKLSMSPPSGEAIDLLTGEPTVSFPPSTWRGNPDAGSRVFIRAPSEDLRKLVEAYSREKRQGRDHPEWLAWARQFADWLLPQQRPDGSFPRAWKRGTNEVVEDSPSSSYSPVSMFAELSNALGPDGARYRDAALRAADYVWQAQGTKGVFTGATLDNPNVIDKEAGMLSLEAFLSAYDLTHDPKWIPRAAAAADFTESWMYIWDVPMAVDAIEGELHWKKGVPTTGVNVISIGGHGGVDQYMDWSAPAYARLYQLTKDPHYLDVARILLLDTKAMLALPGRTFDTMGPGWQQENFDLSTRRGFGGHRGWLPWVSVHHLWSMIGIEMIDPALLKQVVASGDATPSK
jgi:hypothetical protein